MSDIVTSRVFVDGERGITAAKLNDITASSVIQPAFYSAKPTANSLVAGDKLLALKAGSYSQADFQTVIDSVGAALSSDAEIWSVRLRSFNAIGNPNFEVDQINCGSSVAVVPGATVGRMDRWVTQILSVSGTMRGTAQQIAANVALPGTNYRITQNINRFTLTTRQASLGASDALIYQQTIEGSRLRELIGDVHSVSILARSSVANLTFGLFLQDAGPTTFRTLTKLCTLGAANTWTLIQLPNIPVWAAGGNFPTTPGVTGYYLGISLAAGSSQMSTVNDVWQTSNRIGALGQANFASSPVNSTFDLAFVQHEPGPVCSTLMDKPFAGANGNLEECLRYYCKSYDYGNAPGTANVRTAVSLMVGGNNQYALGTVRFPKAMVKIPNTSYWGTDGTFNAVTPLGAANIGVTGNVDLGCGGFAGLVVTPAPINNPVILHYSADTGF